MKIFIDTESCGLRKSFQHLKQPFKYSTLGYFDVKKNNWVETYSFSNGAYAEYDWKPDGKDFLLSVSSSSFDNDGLSRNRWRIIKEDYFQIIVESSNDDGKTWIVQSTTNMRKVRK